MAEKESAIYTAYEKIEKIKKMMQCGPFVLDCDTVLYERKHKKSAS